MSVGNNPLLCKGTENWGLICSCGMPYFVLLHNVYNWIYCVMLLNKSMWFQLCNSIISWSVYCIVCWPPHVQSLSITIYPPVMPSTSPPSGSHHTVVCIYEGFFVSLFFVFCVLLIPLFLIVDLTGVDFCLEFLPEISHWLGISAILLLAWLLAAGGFPFLVF